MEQNTYSMKEKMCCVVKWFKEQKDEELFYCELYSYLADYPDSMFNLAIFLDYYNKKAEKIIEYSKNGRMLNVFENIDSFFKQVEERNPKKYDELINDFYKRFLEQKNMKIKKL